VAGRQLKILQCPSAEQDRWVTAAEDPANYDYGGQGACGDYAGVREIDVRLVALGLVDPAGNYKGVLSDNYLTRLADVTDGTSQTILITECAGRPNLWRAGSAGSGGLRLGRGLGQWNRNLRPGLDLRRGHEAGAVCHQLYE